MIGGFRHFVFGKNVFVKHPKAHILSLGPSCYAKGPIPPLDIFTQVTLIDLYIFASWAYLLANLCNSK